MRGRVLAAVTLSEGIVMGKRAFYKVCDFQLQNFMFNMVQKISLFAIHNF